MFSKLSKGYKIASPGAGVAVLSFFLPWFLVSCGGAEISLSGWDLVVGKSVRSDFMQSSFSGSPIVFVALLAGVSILALALLSARRGQLVKVLDGGAVCGLSSLALLIVLLVMAGLESQATEEGLMVAVDYQIGLWGVLFGYLASFVGGLLNLLSRATVTQAHSLPSPASLPSAHATNHDVF
ncbi:MAG: hypothetical protein RMM31_06595 [Anaerolineae bacterium]|nr:hypothetical protein [Thermoflexales bacterium]MDW8395892.1 hypothetical protein [Anaerolineae bacterium]